MTELLVPAGSLPVLKTAVRYGCDAVYVGGEQYGLRAKAKNFTNDDLAEGIRYCHANGKKLYVTANILAHNRDLAGVRKYFSELNEMLPDAVILADPGVFMIAKETLRPEIAIHISTQANNVNAETFKFWHGLGASRIVCGRELSLAEIAQIRAEVPKECEIEAFIHGAMCISYSGRCLLSSYMTGRDANLGACTHPCRFSYALVEEKRPGEYFPIEENERGSFILSSRDLCMIDHIPELIAAGVDCFKVEGRMKNAMYVATVARAYRMAIDDVMRGSNAYEDHLPYYRAELAGSTARMLTTGFFFGQPGDEAMEYGENAQKSEHVYLGTVESVNSDGEAVFLQKNKFCVGDDIEFLKPDGRNVTAHVTGLRDAEGNTVDACPQASRMFTLITDVVPEEGDVMRAKSRNA
ncbi:MAG: U32 family peptidase [Lachnospiraceae bacterium]|nr:U32 family peptidase [Lachnospiraceae bacterium]